MVTLRLTRKLQKFLGVDYAEELKPATNTLGDWYANGIGTDAGDLILFVNARTLLSVAVPISEADKLAGWFPLRVANLLGMIGVPPTSIEKELRSYDHIQFGKTISRSVLGSLNDLAYQYQAYAEQSAGEKSLSLSRAELEMSKTPFKLIDHRFPLEAALELLASQ